MCPLLVRVYILFGRKVKVPRTNSAFRGGKKLVSEHQTKTGNWDDGETFRPLRGFFSLRSQSLSNALEQTVLNPQCTEESRHSQRKDQFVSLTRHFTTQKVDGDLLGRETPCKRHKLVLSLTIILGLITVTRAE